MKFVTTLLSGAVSLAACGEFTGELPSNTRAFASLDGLPGRIGVMIRGADSKVWRFEIRQGQLSPVGSLPAAPRNATSVGVGLEKPSGMPERGDLAPHGPFAASGDKKYFAAAMDLKPPRDSVPHNLTVARIQGGDVVYESGREDSSVEAIAWSPDSRYVAVLRKAKSSRVNSPIEILSAMFGHPVQYSDYWIEVIEIDGKKVSRAQIAADVRSSWGEIIWSG